MSISREELLGKIQGGEAVALIEALGPAYFADAHLPGAINIPADQVDRLAATLLPDLTAEVVVYCSGTCENAQIVAARLDDLGYERVGVYRGGKEDWVEHG